jgi:pimeloyl-ACP methyl ester carboxylesterase
LRSYWPSIIRKGYYLWFLHPHPPITPGAASSGKNLGSIYEEPPDQSFRKRFAGILKVWEYLNGLAEFDEELAREYTRNLYERQEIAGALGESHARAQAHLNDRSENLRKLRIPTLVLHGKEDYLVDKFGGIQTAESIPDSKLVLRPRMGHMMFNAEIKRRFEDEIMAFFSRFPRQSKDHSEPASLYFLHFLVP